MTESFYNYSDNELDDEVHSNEDDGETSDGDDGIEEKEAERLKAEAENKAREAGF